MRRPRTLIIIASAPGSLGGCREDDRTRAVDAVHEFLSALERADGASACHRLAEAGVSEPLLAAVRANVDAEGLDAPGAEHCTIVAARLANGVQDRVAQLRVAPVTGVAVEGDTAAVRTGAGAYETREVDGHWRVARYPSVRVVRALGARVRGVESRDGRFRIRVALQRGTNRLLLEASAPDREPIEPSVTLTRGPRRGANG